ncbi:hypothetical protein KR067_003076, partial [Drosophila pandora]
SREYVLGLQMRSKWHQEQVYVRKGDLVLVAEDYQPPLCGSPPGSSKHTPARTEGSAIFK